MRLARTRSTIVKTVQVTGFNWDAVEQFCGPGNVRRRTMVRTPRNTEPDGVIGEVWSHPWRVWLPVRLGDWVEAGPHGHLQPVRAAEHAARYQPLHG